MSNEIKFTIDISDQLLGKLLHAIKKQDNMALPMQALLGMAMQPQQQTTDCQPCTKHLQLTITLLNS